ncbi:MAG: hypothetical protein WD872_11365 [Pirellulaceae bacterium]
MTSWPPNQSDPSPYAPPTGMGPLGAQPRRQSLLWLWVLLGFGSVGLLCCCGGVVGVMLFGMNVVEAEVADLLRDNPKLRQHVGEIESLELDWVATAAKEDDETFVYRVQGDRGSGVLTVEQTEDDDWNKVIVRATLRLPDGTQVQIVP